MSLEGTVCNIKAMDTYHSKHQLEEACKKSLLDLGLEYLHLTGFISQ